MYSILLWKQTKVTKNENNLTSFKYGMCTKPIDVLGAMQKFRI